MRPDLDSLSCFVAAATALHFGEAARRVALSPAAFGARIRRLEQDVGATLFERTTRRVQLTPAGSRLLRHAEACLAQVDDCARVAQELTNPPFTLTVGSRYELGMSWLVPMLADLERARPERSIHLRFGDTVDLIPHLRSGELDAVITSARLTEARLQYVSLHEERYVFIASAALLASKPLRAPADALAHTLLDTLPDRPLFRYLRDARDAQELWRFAEVQTLGTIAAVRARALEGRGVAVLPHYFVKADLAQGRLRPILARTKLASDWFRLVFPERHPRADALVALATSLRAAPLR